MLGFGGGLGAHFLAADAALQLLGPAERNDLRKIERALSIQMRHFRVRGVNAGAVREYAA